MSTVFYMCIFLQRIAFFINSIFLSLPLQDGFKKKPPRSNFPEGSQSPSPKKHKGLASSRIRSRGGRAAVIPLGEVNNQKIYYINGDWDPGP